MRDLITGLAIIVIVVLTAALTAPYFIDWNGQRAFVEARLSHALGQKVTIGGSIDVKLLPTPYLVLDQTVIGGDDGPIRIGIRHLDLEVSVAPLLHGEFEVVEAKLEDPTIRIALEADRTLPALPMGPAFQADVRFDRVSVSNGTLAIADPTSGRTFVLDNLDFDADAPSLAGPFKISGSEGPSDASTKFRIATTTAQNGRARTHVVIGETSRHAGLDLDGTVALTSAGRETVRQSFDGTIAASGHLDQGSGTPIAWTLAGPLKADPARATLTGGDLRLGGEEAGLRLAATGDADLGATPTLHLDLTGKQLDIDRLAGGPVDVDGKANRPPPPTLPDLATLRRALSAAFPPLPTALDVSIDTATWGGETLSDIAVHVGGKRLQVGADGPGGSRLGVDGTIGTTDAVPFAGTVEVSADNASRALGWLATVAPNSGVTAGSIPFHRVKLAGKVVVGAGAIDAKGLAVTLDRSSLSGTAQLALSARPKLTLDLRAKVLDLDALPDLASVRDAARGTDLDLTLAADRVEVSHVGDGALGAGRLDLAMTTNNGTVMLTRFSARDLGGATIAGHGMMDASGAALTMTVDATRLDAAAALVRQLAPGGPADALVARAPVLAPAKLTIDATLAAPAKGRGLAPTRVKIDGTLGATTIQASVSPDAGGTIALAATLEAPEGSVLLRQLGLPTLPLDLVGKSRVTLAAKGPSDRSLDTTIQAAFGASRLTVKGRFALFAGSRLGSGTFDAASRDVSPLLQSLALAFPEMTGAMPASMTGGLALGEAGLALSDLNGTVGGVGVKGALRWQPGGADAPALTGSLALDRLRAADLVGLALGPAHQPSADAAWSNAAFASGLVDPPRASVALEIGTFELLPSILATRARLDLDIARNVVAMRKAAASFANGSIGGDLTLRRDGRQGTLEGKLALDHVDVDQPGLRTKLTATLDLAGGGTSALGLVSSLAGTGTATLADAVVPKADPSALPKVFAEVESDDLAVDQAVVVQALRQAADAPLDAGTRTFALNLAGGTIALDETNEPARSGQDVAASLAGTLDLRRLQVTQTVRETLEALPKGWTGPPPSVAFKVSGSPRAPERSIDVSAFIDAVATRALARESARIEAYEFDIRERALFNQRLQSERRRDQDRLEAEAEARKAEADRRAKIEAARQEKARADAEARDEKARADAASRAEAARVRGPEPPSGPTPQSDPFQAPAQGGAVDPTAAGRY